jgi:hypothetical protein
MINKKELVIMNDKLVSICKILKIPFEKPFQIEGSEVWYRIDSDGYMRFTDENGLWKPDKYMLQRLMTGSAVPKWSPAIGELYYYPNFIYANYIDCVEYKGLCVDERIKNSVGIYQTAKEAQDKAKALGWM